MIQFHFKTLEFHFFSFQNGLLTHSSIIEYQIISSLVFLYQFWFYFIPIQFFSENIFNLMSLYPWHVQQHVTSPCIQSTPSYTNNELTQNFKAAINSIKVSQPNNSTPNLLKSNINKGMVVYSFTYTILKYIELFFDARVILPLTFVTKSVQSIRKLVMPIFIFVWCYVWNQWVRKLDDINLMNMNPKIAPNYNEINNEAVKIKVFFENRIESTF